jgi:3'(2'), 5'-bisphosphate nucleotidase
MSTDYRGLLDLAGAAAMEAGAEILRVYASDFKIAQKDDASPVTIADHLAEAVVLKKLGAATPDIPVVSEEHCAAHGLPDAAESRFWLVDPLDGTKEFIKRNGEFTVNIALIEHRRRSRARAGRDLCRGRRRQRDKGARRRARSTDCRA